MNYTKQISCGFHIGCMRHSAILNISQPFKNHKSLFKLQAGQEKVARSDHDLKSIFELTCG